MKNGLFNGVGVIELEDGSEIIGEWLDGKEHGFYEHTNYFRDIERS